MRDRRLIHGQINLIKFVELWRYIICYICLICIYIKSPWLNQINLIILQNLKHICLVQFFKNRACSELIPKWFRSNRSQIFYKIGVLKNFAKFIAKHLLQSLFMKVAGLKLQTSRPKTSLKRDSCTDIFQ